MVILQICSNTSFLPSDRSLFVVQLWAAKQQSNSRGR